MISKGGELCGEESVRGGVVRRGGLCIVRGGEPRLPGAARARSPFPMPAVASL